MDKPPRRRSLAPRLALVAAALVAALVLAELAATLYVRVLAGADAFQRYASLAQLTARFGGPQFQAHRHVGYLPTPGYRRGANAHDALGLRGEGFPVEKPPGETRIACLGASTTYGWGVLHDHRLSYPAILGEHFRERGLPVRVINAGTPGWTTLEVLIDFQTRILDLRPDTAIVYVGLNDVMPRVVWPKEAYRSDLSGWLRREWPARCPSPLEHFNLSRILLVETGRLLPHSSFDWVIGDRAPTDRYFDFRLQRGAGTYPSGVFADTPVEAMLEANPPVFFERNVRSLLALAAAHGVRVVLTTFAMHSGFTDKPFAGHPAVRQAVAQHNEIQRRIAAETGTALFDLARLLPDDESLYTDGYHFTEKGNRRRVELLLADKDLLR